MDYVEYDNITGMPINEPCIANKKVIGGMFILVHS